MRVPKGIVPLFAAMLVVGLAAGCTATTPDLPTISGAFSPGAKTLESIAQTYADCMTTAGISVEIQPNQTGEMAVVQPSGYDSYLYRFEDGSGSSYNVDTEVQDEYFGANVVPGHIQPVMLLDGTDYSDDFAECLAVSGYSYLAATHNESSPIPPETMQAQVDANNRWAECVRENGFPDVADMSVPPDTGGYMRPPMVVLPFSMTADQLRQLFAQCPMFDADYVKQAQEMNDWYATHPNGGPYPGDIVLAPMMEFSNASDATLSPEDAAHLQNLRAVISEQYEVFQ